MKFKYPLAETTWNNKEIESMHNVMDSGMFTMGAEVKKFEDAFAQYHGVRHAVMVNSGSSANLLMIAALFYISNKDLKLKIGDEVIVPAVSWATTYTPLYQYGLKIKFVDIDLETLNYDLDKLVDAVSDKTRVILAVNLLGNPNDFGRINSIIGTKNIILLEDNCEALGSSINKKLTGTFGLIGSFSTFFSHHISTMEGGMIITNNTEIYHILLSIRSHGWTRHLPNDNYVCTKSKDDFNESFRFVLPGYNVRPLELSGAVGIQQLRKLPDLLIKRNANKNEFINVMKDHPDLMIQKEIGHSSWFGFSLMIRKESKLTRNKLRDKLNIMGIECRPIVAGNFTKNEVVKYFNYEIHGNLDNADYLDSHGLFIGNKSFNTENGNLLKLL